MKNKPSHLVMMTAILLLSVFGSLAQEKPVVGVAGISHESNSFSSHMTNLEDFKIKLGEETKDRAERFFSLANARTTISGYIAGASRYGLKLYPA